MQQQWQAFLRQQGARIDDGQVTDFGDADGERQAAASGTILADLSHEGLIAVSGKDAREFLQNQFGNDINQVSATRAQLSSYCNAKGRMLAIFQVLLHDDTYCLILPEDILEATLKRLRMFVLRSDVTLASVGDQWARFGIAGPDAEAALREVLGEVPGEPWTVLCHDAVRVLRLPDPCPRFAVHGPNDELAAMWETLAVNARPVGKAVWTWFNVRAGLPELHPATVEAFVPQMANLEALGAISFKKGCYPGQEVVARMHYLGKLKRRMYLAHVQTETPPAPGTAVFAENAEQSSGKVVIAAPAPTGGVDLLAVLQIADADAPLRLAEPGGAPLTLQPLPYDVPSAD